MTSSDRSIYVSFCTMKGSKWRQVLREDFTLADFKQALEERDYDIDRYRFICHGKELHIENETEFNSQKQLIRNGVSIFLCHKMCGGGGGPGVEFVDLNNTEGLQRHEWKSSAPDWRRAGPGICLEGKCGNASCKAYQQQVIMHIGFKKFDLLKDVTSNTSKCPICSKYVEPITCAFSNCRWRWEGIKQPQRGMPPEKISADWQLADNAYHVFDENISGTTIWRELIIEAQKT